MLEKELLINLTLEEGYENYINFIEAFKNIVEDKEEIIGFLRDNLTKDLLIRIFNYNLNNTLAFNKIIFNKYREEIPSTLSIDIEDLIKIPNLEDIVNYTLDNLEDFLKEEEEELSIMLDSYNINLFIFNIISYYYKNPFKEAINKTIEYIRERLIDYSNRVIELEEDSNNLYIEYKEKDLYSRKESREGYYRELGKISHRKKRLIDKIKRLEDRLGELEYIEL